MSKISLKCLQMSCFVQQFKTNRFTFYDAVRTVKYRNIHHHQLTTTTHTSASLFHCSLTTTKRSDNKEARVLWWSHGMVNRAPLISPSEQTSHENLQQHRDALLWCDGGSDCIRRPDVHRIHSQITVQSRSFLSADCSSPLFIIKGRSDGYL